MPQIGEVKEGRAIGKRYNKKYIWQACADCGKERWVYLNKSKPSGLICKQCQYKLFGQSGKGRTGSLASNWKGGRNVITRGYIEIKLYPEDFFYPMAMIGGYVLEHRLVVAKALGRCLLPWEVVHHKGTKYPLGSKEDKGDNRYPENLELLPTGKQHLPSVKWAIELTKRDKRIEQLEIRVTLLEDENILLKAEREQVYEQR